jgi:DNA-binding PadR family transcriptional regulator
VGKPVDLVQGTVDLLILKAIGPVPLHGWAIARRINQLSQDAACIRALWYPALRRLERADWISAEWGPLKTTAGRASTA